MKKNLQEEKRVFLFFLKIDFYQEFLTHKVAAKSVLVIEPNNYHGEVVPGFVKYWQDLGYHVDVIMRIGNYEENPFALFKKSELPNIYPLQKWRIKSVLKSPKAQDYDFVFISSFDYQETKERYYDYLGFEPKSKYGSLWMSFPWLKTKPSSSARFILVKSKNISKTPKLALWW